MNEEIVDDALADIALHPEMHNQYSYGVSTACGTKMCLAGFILLRKGYRLLEGGWQLDGKCIPIGDVFNLARDAAEMTNWEASEMFLASAFDDLKQLMNRWNRLTGREL